MNCSSVLLIPFQGLCFPLQRRPDAAAVSCVCRCDVKNPVTENERHVERYATQPHQLCSVPQWDDSSMWCRAVYSVVIVRDLRVHCSDFSGALVARCSLLSRWVVPTRCLTHREVKSRQFVGHKTRFLYVTRKDLIQSGTL